MITVIETHWNTPVAFLHAQTTKSFPMLNLYFIDLFIFWRVQVKQLNFKNIGNLTPVPLKEKSETNVQKSH